MCFSEVWQGLIMNHFQTFCTTFCTTFLGEGERKNSNLQEVRVFVCDPGEALCE